MVFIVIIAYLQIKVRVLFSRKYRRVPQYLLQRALVHAVAQQMGGKGVAQHMRMQAFGGNAGLQTALVKYLPEGDARKLSA